MFCSFNRSVQGNHRSVNKINSLIRDTPNYPLAGKTAVQDIEDVLTEMVSINILCIRLVQGTNYIENLCNDISNSFAASSTNGSES